LYRRWSFSPACPSKPPSPRRCSPTSCRAWWRRWFSRATNRFIGAWRYGFAATPAAFAGAWAVSVFDPRLLAALLGLLTFLSGLNALRTQKLADVSNTEVPGKVLVVIGAVTGFLSSVTGTGGPMVLVPILMSMSVPVLTAVGLSQAIQLPVAIAATFGNVLYGKLDMTLASVLAASLTIGSWFGANLAHSVPRAVLRAIVSTVLVVIGVFILANVCWRLLR
jgi:uncharacterized membrane protein YfcA